MKRNALFALAVLSAAAAGAQAADVTVYGQANVSLYYQDTKSGDSSLTMQNEASRVGLRAHEALTDETDVFVHLETGYGLDDGTLTENGRNNTGTTLFDRRAFLAVKHKRFGELAMGRMGTVRSSMAPYGYALGMLDPFGTNYGPDGSISGMFGNDTRGNNTITYMAPKVGGFSGGVSYSMAAYDNEDPGAGHNDRHLSVMANYANGPLYVVAAATEARWGKDHSAGSDKGYAYEREDGRATRWARRTNSIPPGSSSSRRSTTRIGDTSPPGTSTATTRVRTTICSTASTARPPSWASPGRSPAPGASSPTTCTSTANTSWATARRKARRATS